jgi:uncharacterized protein YdhG (YjbR/CyaY superfamily)
MPMPPAPPDVDTYINNLPPGQREAMQKVRTAIKEAAPKAQEVISYQIPGYKYLGPVVYIAAFKNHCSLFGISKSLLETFKKELSKFEVAGTTIHFTPEKPLPVSLIKKIVKARVKQNEERNALAKAKKASNRSVKRSK